MNIAIIGAGPGGLYAAIEAVKRGLTVRLFERGEVGDHIHCGEGFFDSFGVLGCPTHGVCFPVKKIIFQVEKLHEQRMDNYNNIWMIDRAEWQRGLREEARSLGVDVQECNHIRIEDCQRLQAENDWVIDASGVFPVSSRVYGFQQHFIDHAGLAYQYVMEGDFSALIGAIKAGFLPNLLGYYWIFPKNPHTANVGIGFIDKKSAPQGEDLKTLLQQVLELEHLRQARVVRRVGGILPNRVMERLVYDNLLLVGNAAGLCSPLHGEGIDLACISGVMAARAIATKEVDQFTDNIHKLMKDKLAVEGQLIDVWKQCDFHMMEELVEAMIDKNIKQICKYALKFPSLLKLTGQWLKTKPVINV